MMQRRLQEFWGVIRGVQLIINAGRRHNEEYLKHLWANSSVKQVVDTNFTTCQECATKVVKNPSEAMEKVQELLKEAFERTSVVVEGVRQYSQKSPRDETATTEVESVYPMSVNPGVQSGDAVTMATLPPIKLDAAHLDISSITLKELEEILKKQKKKDKRGTGEHRWKSLEVQKEEHDEKHIKPSSAMKKDEAEVEKIMDYLGGKQKSNTSSIPSTTNPLPAQKGYPTATGIELPKLSSVAKQRKVPASRISRIASFGGLFAGLGLGTVNELTKGALGLGGASSMKEAVFSPANTERIVDTLCRVRGAALKLGQILSIQDETIISPQIVKAFERVRQAADYMPDWQVDRVMSAELGGNWKEKFASFDEKPFAAASIGQVHRGVLSDGTEVAIKIQYPGVAKSIESDIDNLVGMLKVWDVFPAGFFIDNVVKVAKRELVWEVDYTREGEYTEKYGEMTASYPEYYVPRVIKKLSTRSVLTTELVPGVPLDKCFELSYDERKFIASSVLKLSLRELFEFQCMQTDPNWSNFLYDSKSRRLMLIDFGSTRFYSRDFIKNYRQVIIAAVKDNRDGVLRISREMGFLTGYESKQMDEAHVNAVMILGEMFRHKGEFDFGKQQTTKKIASLVPTMVAHRLCPPPEEIYSIHRKLSGIFLLCAKLNVKFACYPLYEEIVLKP